ncbi:MAG: tripartite tricarboxylate transporter substrate binding protein [Rhodospirillales bacterium]|nr:tripartite tricarboxylate transporter substrate binding protein [Rhodospirillales bacterium]
MALSRRTFLAASACMVASGGVSAQTRYPVSPVTLVTHSSPGGGSDVFLRELIKHLTPVMGTNFAVENVRGGSGAAAVAKVAKAAPNGGMFYATTPTYIQTSLLSKPEVGYDGLDPIVVVFLDPEVIYTRAESPFKTLAEAVAYAKANPGKGKWGAANPASLERIALERMKKVAGAQAAVVSHEGGGDLMINVLNGTLDIGIGEIQEIRAQLEAGKIRLLGVLTEKRLPDFASLPTAREQGLDVVVTKFRGLAGPKGIPDEIAAQWERAIRQVLESPAFKAEYAKDSLVPVPMGRVEARAFVTKFAGEITANLRELGVIK